MRRISRIVLTLVFSFSLFYSAIPGSAAEETLRLEIKTDNVLNRIDEKVYGHFLEHIYHSCDGGLWGELVWNRSFEENNAGSWSIEEKEIIQSGPGHNQRLVLGDPEWNDYEFTLEANKTGGQEGFLILFRVRNENEFYWLNLGGWDNTRHRLQRGISGQNGWNEIGPNIEGNIEQGRWYKIKVRLEGRHIQCWLDDRLAVDFTDDEGVHLSGAAGVGTWATQARYRNLKVTSLEGKVLFEGVPETAVSPMSARHWTAYGPGKASMRSGNALNCSYYVRITAGDTETGLEQRNYCIKKGEKYEGSLWARGTGSIAVRLVNGDTLIGEDSINKVQNCDKWSEYKFSIKAAGNADNGALRVGVEPGGDVWIDQVSLMPKSWRKNGGFRPDLLQAIKDLKPPTIRWPGGCFASAYRWKQGIGPQHKRKIHPHEIWDQKDVYSMGTDEFIELCRKVGAEPIIVVNIGTPMFGGPGREKEFDQEVLDWIEYCNGPKDSKWGKVRAENGHPKPYNVKYWEIDNETWGMGADNYAARVNHLAPLMRKTDPAIKLIACGSGGLADNGMGMVFNSIVIDKSANMVDYLSIHHYEDPNRFADGPGNYEIFIRRIIELIKKSNNPDLKIFCSEWNAQSTDWRTGLYCGGVLNAFERCGDVFEIGGPALFLRHISARDWDNAFINFDHRSWFPAPNYVVMKLWRNHYLPQRIAIEGQTGSLNIVATKSEDGRKVCVKAVNPYDKPVTVNLALDGNIKNASAQKVTSNNLHDRNTLEMPDTIKVEEADISIDGAKITFAVPEYSAMVVDMEK